MKNTAFAMSMSVLRPIFSMANPHERHAIIRAAIDMDAERKQVNRELFNLLDTFDMMSRCDIT